MLPFPSSSPPRRSISPSQSHLLDRSMDSDEETDPFSNHSSEIEAEILLGFTNPSHRPPEGAVEAETFAYHALVSEGGRPSHPLSQLKSIVSAPGKYRDILAFWQDQSDEWQVFSKQLTRWRMFLSHQKSSRRPPRYPNHLEELTERLERHSFALPPGFDKPPNGFCRHIDQQNKLATWIEYINYEFTRRDEYDKWLETCQPGYDAALAQLMDAQVLGPFEQVRTPTSDICRPSSLEVTRRRDERRRAEEECETARNRLNWKDPLGGPRTSQQMEREQRLYTEARERLRMINKRGYVISDFARKTHAYRFAQERSERHELLLRWALDQIPLIEEELRREDQLALAGKIRGVSPSCDRSPTKQSFPLFQQLPPEIRHRIWCELIPRRPSVHFFDVLNHQRRRHLAPSWSTEEFRVRATTSRNSGYLSVYTLLATCRESRRLVEIYYMCRHRGIKCPLSGGTINFNEQPPDFRTFDWIPFDDLVVLNFPPIQVTHLPAGNAFTLSPGPNQAARNIGVCVPTEIMSMNHFSPTDEGEGDDDAAQIPLIPEFINKLHRPIHPDHENGIIRRGIWKLYLIVEGWVPNHMTMQVSVGIDTNTSVDKWAANHISWLSQSARKEERTQPWKNIMRVNPEDDPPPEDSNERRLWWLGSGDSALASLCPNDSVQKSAARRLREFMETLAGACDLQPWHKGFNGVEALGWLEPAGMDVLEAHPWDVVEIIRNRGGRPPAHWKGRGQFSN
ncbi:hypothetical protein H0G86_004784 [Trichoderma simmonsii]|uniref:2EXR domain-containing protein n=1 Tax=Trichoderma simmonsii TaxID=1491479 RepID=A0A8G0L8E5_9HYPO|nr:hypothetical protein H0G86_004784 [Trichoderma simmonsii]